MQAIILAAGMGRRLGELTKNNTKCMLEVNGRRLIDRFIDQLSKYNLHRIVIVVGYEGKKPERNLGVSEGKRQKLYCVKIKHRSGLHKVKRL